MLGNVKEKHPVIYSLIVGFKLKAAIIVFVGGIIRRYRWIFEEMHVIRLYKYYLTKVLFRDNKLKDDLSRPTIAVVVPCFGHAKFLKQALYSITNQDEKPDEIVLVNDCSNDNTLEILTDFVNNLPSEWRSRFKVVDNVKNLGQAASINIAIQACKAELIMVLNDDDLLDKSIVRVLRTQFMQNKSLGLIGVYSRSFDVSEEYPNLDIEVGEPICIKIFEPNIANKELRKPFNIIKNKYQPFIYLVMTHSGSVFTRKAWQESGMYYPKNKRIGEFSDFDFHLRVALKYPVAIIDSCTLSCLRLGSSVDHNVNS